MMSIPPEEQSPERARPAVSQIGQVLNRIPLLYRIAVPAAAIILIGVAAFAIPRPPDGPSHPTPTNDPNPPPLMLGATLDAEHVFASDQAGSLNWLFLSGAELSPDGSINSDRITIPADSESLDIFPILRVTEITSSAQSAIEAVAAFASDERYAGIIIDTADLSPSSFASMPDFVKAINKALNSDRVLIVRIPVPEEVNQGWAVRGANWAQLGESADYLLLAPTSPTEIRAGGSLERLLRYSDSELPRSKLLISLSAVSVDEWGVQFNPIPFEYALAPIGTVREDRTNREPVDSPDPGEPLTFHLTGDAANLQQSNSMYSYEFFAGDGVHRIHVLTGAALRAQLDWLGQQNLAGIILEGYYSPDVSEGIAAAVQEFQSGALSTLDPDLSLRWQVSTVEGHTYAESISELGTPFEWEPSEEGEYIVSADLLTDQPVTSGSIGVIVGGTTVGVAPENEGVVSGVPSGDEPTPVASNPGFIPPAVIPPSASGGFELGGQVMGPLIYPDHMHRAGMTWVKHQVQWGPQNDPAAASALIQSAHAQNFKVLLSVPGRAHYPDTIDFAGYIEYVRALAGYGPDAIEVWNEANLDFEWPRGQIDGGSYVRQMLAPAYNAIKSVDPSIMIISGALAPTGAFYGDGGCSKEGVGCDDWLYLQQMANAGAANYMDCVGVHFNSGATSPTANTGHPADPGFQHYSWYFPGMVGLYGGTFGRPLCFTELGFLTGEGLGSVPSRFSWAQDTSLAEQAQWLAEAAQISMQNGNIRLMIVWNVDFTYWGDDPMAGYAILRPDGSCPACDSLDQVMP